MSAPIVETRSRILASGRVVNIPVGRKPAPKLPVAVAEAPVVAPPMVAKKAEGGGGSRPVKTREEELTDEYRKKGYDETEIQYFVGEKLRKEARSKMSKEEKAIEDAKLRAYERRKYDPRTYEIKTYNPYASHKYDD